MEKHQQPVPQQQTLTFDSNRMDRLTERERVEVVAAVADLLRAAATGTTSDPEATNEGG